MDILFLILFSIRCHTVLDSRIAVIVASRLCTLHTGTHALLKSYIAMTHDKSNS